MPRSWTRPDRLALEKVSDQRFSLLPVAFLKLQFLARHTQRAAH